jgi:hypothetical protein
MSPPSFNPRTVHCSSKYASINYDTTMTKCNFQLNRPISIPQEYELHISVLSACIPFSFYGIPATTITYTVGGTNNNWSIMAGNWSGTDLATLLTTSAITVKFIQQTGLFQFTAGSSTVVLPISPLLGITSPITLTASQSKYAQAMPDIAGTRFINILSSLNTDCITTGTTTGGSGVLLSIPVSAAPNNFIIFAPQNLVRNKLKESYVSNFDITICDSNMTPLNMNGIAWELDLLVEVLIPNDQPYNEAPVGDLFNATRMYNPRKI